MFDNLNKRTLKVFFYEDVKIVTEEGKKLGVIGIWQENWSGKRYIDLHGRAGWFSSSDPNIKMEIHPTDIRKIMSLDEFIKIYLQNSKFISIEVLFNNYEKKNKCYELINKEIVNYIEPKKERLFSMSLPDEEEELAEQFAMMVLKLENIAYVFNGPDNALNDLLDVRQELIQLVNSLGGHPAVPRI